VFLWVISVSGGTIVGCLVTGDTMGVVCWSVLISVEIK
jgi:hypothetical protein